MEYYFAVLTFTFVGTITPGPNNIMLMTSGLNHGFRRSIPHYLGVTIGFPIMVVAVGLGMGTAFTMYPYLHRLIAISGMAYLLFLAWKIANAGSPEASSKTKAPLTFIQAAGFQWVNPKAWFIAIGAMAAFIVPGRLAESMAFITLAYLVVGFVSMGIWLKLGQSLNNVLQDHKRIRCFNITMGILLALSVIPMLVSEFQ